MTIVAGVDFGTQSVRFSIFDSQRGRLGSGASSYPVLRRSDDSDYAAQSHADHMRALVAAAQQAIAAAGVNGHEISALGIDTTGSTIVTVDENLQPLDDYYLWCDHRGWREAAEITRVARDISLEALRWCGGTYSSEFGLAKLWHWLRNHPEKRARFATAVEHCDLVTATLCGITDLDELPRSVCAMGHKWMWNESLGGRPSEEFLSSLDPLLAGLRGKMPGRYARSNTLAGVLSPQWARELGLKPGIPLPVGARSMLIGMRSARESDSPMSSTSSALPPVSWPSAKNQCPFPASSASFPARFIPAMPASKPACPRLATSLIPSRDAPEPRLRILRRPPPAINPGKLACCASPGTAATVPSWPTRISAASPSAGGSITAPPTSCLPRSKGLPCTRESSWSASPNMASRSGA